ncbi:MAG: zf-HC2 domain-containing protein [Acidobacteria bacterium]|nr:zf-HC2 domain-containing protein [Acidobacteriota bacterium]
MRALLFGRSDCADVLVRLGSYLDGELRDGRRQRLEAHVASCQRCSAELEQLQSLRKHVRRSLAVSLPDRDADLFWEKVERKIRGARAPRWWALERIRESFWSHPSAWWASAAALGAAILLFTADFILRPAIPPPTRVGPADAPPRTVVESVEGGPNSSVFLLSSPDQQIKIIWVLEREKS